MDPRVEKAVLGKIEAAISNTDEVSAILEKLGDIPVQSKGDFAFGIAIGRIYNSFHYQTRRTLGRNASHEEFLEFLEILHRKAPAIKAALEKQ